MGDFSYSDDHIRAMVYKLMEKDNLSLRKAAQWFEVSPTFLSMFLRGNATAGKKIPALFGLAKDKNFYVIESQ